MSEIRVDSDITSALDALGASAAQAPATGKCASVTFANNDMPCFENYKACISQLGKLASQYQGLLTDDANKCKALVAEILEADRQIARQIMP